MATTTDMELRPISPVAGVEIRGLDLAEPLDALSQARISQAILDHHVVVFKDQALEPQHQLDFTQRFGELEEHVIRLRDGNKAPALHVISNLDAQGHPTSKPYSHGNYFWHTDKSYHAVPSFSTLLHAVELPPVGGDTQFANMHLAYEAMSDGRKRELAGLRLVHSWEASRRNTGNRPATEDEKRDRPPVNHPLVRTHPDTGRKSLYCGIHVSHVEGIPLDESKAFLSDLLAEATQDQFVYSHAWQAGDLVMWDNRCLLHQATANFDMDQHRRVLHRTVIRGTVPF